jgi:hypothetical protein
MATGGFEKEVSGYDSSAWPGGGSAPLAKAVIAYTRLVITPSCTSSSPCRLECWYTV